MLHLLAVLPVHPNLELWGNILMVLYVVGTAGYLGRVESHFNDQWFIWICLISVASVLGLCSECDRFPRLVCMFGDEFVYVSVMIYYCRGEWTVTYWSHDSVFLPPPPLSNPSFKHLNDIMQLLAWNPICTLSFFILVHNVNMRNKKLFFFPKNVLFHKPKKKKSRTYQE